MMKFKCSQCIKYRVNMINPIFSTRGQGGKNRRGFSVEEDRMNA
jgi:protein-arginine kinase activator protein McsA